MYSVKTLHENLIKDVSLKLDIIIKSNRYLMNKNIRNNVFKEGTRGLFFTFNTLNLG